MVVEGEKAHGSCGRQKQKARISLDLNQHLERPGENRLVAQPRYSEKSLQCPFGDM